MILACQGICKSFGEKEILKDASFHIEEREKVALIGNNGAGKTTLLRIIMEEFSADSGNVILAKDKRMGYLAQYQDIYGQRTIYEELLTTKQHILDMEERMRSIELEMKHVQGEELEQLMNTYTRLTHEFELENGYAYKSELTGILKGLGFGEEDFEKPIETLSGGQKTRVALGKLLISRPDILLLDEPTNHLDMESIAWLETYLLNYPGAVFIVSHDRYFLDKVVTKVVEIEAGQVISFQGNYSSYAEKKAQLRDAQYKAYLNQQREIKHQEAVIVKLKSFNREKSIRRAESREKMLDKIQRLDKPVEIQTHMRLSLEPRTVSGNDVLTVEELSKSFPGQTLFTNISFQIKRGERIALIGNYHGTSSHYTTILEGIQNEAAEGTTVLYAQGCHLFEDRVEHLGLPGDRLSEARIAARHSDVVILCVGLDETLEGEEGDTGNSYSSGDKEGLELPASQRRLMEELLAQDKPVIVCNMTGSAIDLSLAQEKAKAVIQAWYPGAEGGTAFARLIFGKSAPGGKLPVTFYKDLSALPAFEDYSMEGRTYRYIREEPLYPFGFGLTYGKAELSDGAVDGRKAYVTARNTGDRRAREVIEVYVNPVDSPDRAEHWSMCGFQRVDLEPGEEKRVELDLGAHTYECVNAEGEYVENASVYEFSIGTSQPDARSRQLGAAEPVTVIFRSGE